MLSGKSGRLFKFSMFDFVIYAVVGIFSLMCLYPFLLVIAGSISTQASILKHGFTLIPSEVTFQSYGVLFAKKDVILNAYKVTIIVTVTGTFFALLINSLMAFCLSRRNLRYRKVFNVLVMIPILFSGGMVPWYIICVRYLHLQNTILALILPSLVNCFNIFLIRNYFYSIPDSMYEAAKIDGASDYMVFFKIYLSLSTSVLATIGLFTSLGYWNDWWLGLMLIDDSKLMPLQLFLRNLVSNIQFLRETAPNPETLALYKMLPDDGLKMCVVIVTIGPIIFVYPFVQKYFVKGIMIGALKG